MQACAAGHAPAGAEALPRPANKEGEEEAPDAEEAELVPATPNAGADAAEDVAGAGVEAAGAAEDDAPAKEKPPKPALLAGAEAARARVQGQGLWRGVGRKTKGERWGAAVMSGAQHRGALGDCSAELGSTGG